MKLRHWVDIGLVLAVWLCVGVVGALAQGVAGVTQYITASGVYQNSPAASCAAKAAQWIAIPGNAVYAPMGTAYTGGTGAYSFWDYGAFGAGLGTQVNCYGYYHPAGPAGSVFSAWAAQAITSAVNNVALSCPVSGEKRTVNFTLGYTEDPTGSKAATVETHANAFTAILAAGSSCVSGGGSVCGVTIGTSPADLGSAWISSQPTATGLYRISQDMVVTSTGSPCTQTTAEKAATESTDTKPVCAGSFGSVNGKGVCVPTSASNRNVIEGPAGTQRLVGNPTAGSSGNLPIGARMPGSGTGGNDGGPSSATDGYPAPVGTAMPISAGAAAPANIEIPENCGKPGAPKCQIDETGTPSNIADQGQSGLNTAMDSLGTGRDTAVSATGKDTGWGLVPYWLTGAASCAPVVLFTLPPAAGSMVVGFDICPQLPTIYTIMNLIWVAVTFGGIVSMVFRTTTSAA